MISEPTTTNPLFPREIPAVDIATFEQAFDVWYKTRVSAPAEEREVAGISAVHSFAAGDRELFLSIGSRLSMLEDLLWRRRKRVLRVQGFPPWWIATAATAPLTRGQRFDPKLFSWTKN